MLFAPRLRAHCARSRGVILSLPCFPSLRISRLSRAIAAALATDRRLVHIHSRVGDVGHTAAGSAGGEGRVRAGEDGS